MDNREELIKRSIVLLEQVKDMTPGTALEQWLNNTYGPRSDVYDNLARLIKAGVEEGWAANIEIDGRRYRRSRIYDPAAETFYFSITAVYMQSWENYRGQYHLHPYGELNMVVPIDHGALLAGPNGWCGEGWTAPAPGSHHYPEVKNGALIALFFLPAGRISYDIKPPAIRLRSIGAKPMARSEHDYDDIPGTFVFDAERSRRGYGVNMFCMSLMKDENRKAFKANEVEYLKRFALTPEQTEAVLQRDYNRMLELGGNIYFAAKLGATDGHSFQFLAALMTGLTQEDYAAMMLAGGRSVEGNRSKSDKDKPAKSKTKYSANRT